MTSAEDTLLEITPIPRVKSSMEYLLKKVSGNAGVDATARGSVEALALKIAATASAFVVSLLLARILTTEGYGIYVYAAAWTNLLAGPAMLGFDRLLVRQVAIYRSETAWALMTGLLRQARLHTFFASIVLSVVGCTIVWLAIDPSEHQMRSTLWMSLLTVPVLTLMSFYQATAQGLKQVVIGQLPVSVIRPAVFILLILTVHVVAGVNLLPAQAMAMNAGITVLTLVLGVKMVRAILPDQVKTSRVYQTEDWTRKALPLLWLGGLYLLNSQADTLLLGAMRESREVAIYNIAKRLTELLTFMLFAVSVTIAPSVAELWAKGAVKQLQDLMRKSVRALASVSIPLAIALVVFGRFALGLFGSDFTQGYYALVILTVGQLTNALAGSVGLVLVMTNYERDVIVAHALGLALNLILCVVLIPRWGIEGTAVARTCSLVFWNVFLAVRVRSRLGIRPLALG